MRSDRDSREFGGADPIDTRLGTPPLSMLERLGFGGLVPLLRPRAALGLRPAMAPAVLILPAGFLLGPHVLNVISIETIGYLETAVTVALAALGVFVGMAFGPHLKTARRLFAASTIEAVITIATVAAAVAFLLSRTPLAAGAPVTLMAFCLGIAAAASSASVPGPGSDRAARTASLVADLDDVVPILLSGMAGVLAASGGPAGEWRPVLAAPAIGLVIGTAGWLLFERAESAAERGALLLGSLALLGGAPAYLDASPLVAGFVAGLFWTLTPGRADRIVSEDLRKIQHPLVVLLLVTAGAMCAPSLAALWLIGPYTLFRLAGKFAGGWVAARVSGPHAAIPSDLGIHLIPPGVIGVAFALAFAQILPPGAGALVVTTVAAGSVLSELAAFYVIPAGPAAA